MPPLLCHDGEAYTRLLLLFSAGAAEKRAYIDRLDEDSREDSADVGQGE